jgi:capsular polysaccharide biosynthesis protein
LNDVLRLRGTRGRLTVPIAVLVVLTVIGALIGFFVGSRTAGKYTAEATVLVTPLAGNPYSPDGAGDDLVNLETEAQLVSSDAVAQVVATDVGASSANDLLDGLNVTVPPNTQILKIDYSSSEQSVARATARSFARAYLDFRKSRADQVVSTKSTRIQDEIDTQTSQLDDLVKKQGAEKQEVRRSVLQKQINGATTQIGQLRTALTDVQTAAADPGQVITPAHVVSRSPASTRILFTAAGALAGLLIGLLILAFRSRTREFDDDPTPSLREPVVEDVPVSPRVGQHQNA